MKRKSDMTEENFINKYAEYMSEVSMEKLGKYINIHEISKGTPKALASEEIIKETLSSKASSSDYIDDFVHSDNKMFSGDSKQKRIRRALGAYYGKKRAVKEDIFNEQNAIEPLIGEDGKKDKKKLKKTKESGPDTPIQLNKGVPNRTSNYGERDTGQSI